MFYILRVGLGLLAKVGFRLALAVVVCEVAVLAHALRVVLLALVFAGPRVLFSFPLVVATDAHLPCKNPPHEGMRASLLFLLEFAGI